MTEHLHPVQSWLLILHKSLTLTCLSTTGVPDPKYKGKARQVARQTFLFKTTGIFAYLTTSPPETYSVKSEAPSSRAILKMSPRLNPQRRRRRRALKAAEEATAAIVSDHPPSLTSVRHSASPANSNNWGLAVERSLQLPRPSLAVATTILRNRPRMDAWCLFYVLRH